MENKHSFQVNSTHQSFKDKQKNLFDELEKVSKILPQQTFMDVDEEPAKDRNDDTTEMRCYKGKKSIFKRPEAPLRRCLPVRRTPDYQINPHKWTKYTLSDVKEDDMSDRANKTAALSFLKELEKRNEANLASQDDDVPHGSGIKFNKSKLIADESGEAEQVTFRSSKLVMPEYVVGQKIKKDRKSREKRSGHTSKQLTLNHLMLNEGDEEDENT